MDPCPHLAGLDHAFQNTKGNIQPSVLLRFRLEEHMQQLLPLLARKGSPALKAKEQNGFIVSSYDAVGIGQHDPIAAPTRVIYPTDQAIQPWT